MPVRPRGTDQGERKQHRGDVVVLGGAPLSGGTARRFGRMTCGLVGNGTSRLLILIIHPLQDAKNI